MPERASSPGPWRWDADERSRNVLRAADGDTIATYDEAYLKPRGAVDIANRALLASAPELLEMLRKLEWVKDEECTAGDGLSCPCCGWVKHTTGHAPDCRLSELLGRLK